MEKITDITVSDKLRDLEQNTLFWFLSERNLGKIQHVQERGRFTSGSFFAETLAADPLGELNDDSFMVLPMGEGRTLFAVLDGASSQKEIEGLAHYGVSGAFYISHLVGLGFGNTKEYRKLCRRENLTAKDVMVVVNSWIYKEIRKVPGVSYDDVPTVPGMAAVFVLVDSKQKSLSIAQVADSAAAEFCSDGTVKTLTPNLNEKFDKESMEYAENLAKKYGYSLAQLRRDKKTRLMMKMQFRDSFCRKTNVKGGCGILNGMPELIRSGLIYTHQFEISNKLSSIYLFSDGALLPYMEKDVSVEAATREFVKVFARSPYSSVLEPGVARLDADPEFVRIPRLKHRDDATVIELRFD